MLPKMGALLLVDQPLKKMKPHTHIATALAQFGDKGHLGSGVKMEARATKHPAPPVERME